MARLIWEQTSGSPVSFPLTTEAAVIGRGEGVDILLPEALVSRTHARIERRVDGYYVLDLGSTNLTRVNGEVVGERQLRHGDEIRFGRTRCIFLTEDQA